VKWSSVAGKVQLICTPPENHIRARIKEFPHLSKIILSAG
jgi:hypothetical protein